LNASRFRVTATRLEKSERSDDEDAEHTNVAAARVNEDEGDALVNEDEGDALARPLRVSVVRRADDAVHVV
jgi:hypothetical protein